VPIARVSAGTLSPEGARALDAWASDRGVACVYLLSGSNDVRSAHVAEHAGFRLMDVRIELRRGVESTPAIQVREARESDREHLREIARRSHGATRFYADPRFPDARCDDLYATWIDRSLDGWAAAVLVAERDGRAVGYCSVHLGEDEGSIGLIAVDDAARGGGVGVELASGAVAWSGRAGARVISVVTQGRNVAALRTFARAGFLVSSVDLWFHKWFDT
jgi:dTDP-4-amino-4,6-dideoxy-D-galactose acyltransferase